MRYLDHREKIFVCSNAVWLGPRVRTLVLGKSVHEDGSDSDLVVSLNLRCTFSEAEVVCAITPLFHSEGLGEVKRATIVC